MKHENKHGLHGWWMIACCTAMLLGVLALTLTGTGIGSYGYLLFLLCPVIHLVMHSRMQGSHSPREEKDSPRLPTAADETNPGQS